jgi:hypothetical protein
MDGTEEHTCSILTYANMFGFPATSMPLLLRPHGAADSPQQQPLNLVSVAVGTRPLPESSGCTNQ